MNEEKKFRAWDGNKKKYIYPPRAINSFIGPYHFTLDGRCYINGVLQNISLEQFIGLHDINGAEIYEGDIVFVDRKDSFPSYNKAIIVYQENTAAFMLQYLKPLHPDGLLADCGMTNKEKTILFDYCTGWQLQVIGNIHEYEEEI